MVTLLFDFDKDKLAEKSKTEDELLVDFREYARKQGITEKTKGFFVMEGENALALFGKFVVKYSYANPDYIDYFNEWLMDVDGDLEDCADTMRNIFIRKGIISNAE
jgi:hypothetical protein